MNKKFMKKDVDVRLMLVIEKLLKKGKVFKYLVLKHCHYNSMNSVCYNLDLLKEYGLIEISKLEGRTRYIILTNKGKKFCDLFRDVKLKW